MRICGMNKINKADRESLKSALLDLGRANYEAITCKPKGSK